MSRKSNNSPVNPNARDAMSRFNMEVAGSVSTGWSRR